MHGGARPGAGRPKEGISQLRRVLNCAIVDGLERAGREKGLTGSAEEVARQSAARIVSDMILAGQGADVLKLAVLAAPKVGENGDGNDGESPVLRALQRMPGMVVVPERSSQKTTQAQIDVESVTYEVSATDYKSDARPNDAPPQPFFAPQQALPLLPADRAAPAPHPPAGAAPTPIYPHSANLEKSENFSRESRAVA